MNAPIIRSKAFWGKLAPFVLAWCVVAAMAIRARWRDPFGPSLTHPGYGENRPGDLRMALLWSAIEFTILAVIIFPWRTRWLVARVSVAAVLFAPWTVFMMIASMHAGSILGTLVIARFGVVLALVVSAIVLGVRAAVQREVTG